MGFSEKMRDSLGVEGAKIEVVPPSDPVTPGDTATFAVVILGGTKAADVDGLTLRLVQAVRHWVGADGDTHDEASVDVDARTTMTAGWTRTTTAEQHVALAVNVLPGARHTIEVELAVPPDSIATSPACTHTLSVQADIKGQIDPTGQARLQLA